MYNLSNHVAEGNAQFIFLCNRPPPLPPTKKNKTKNKKQNKRRFTGCCTVLQITEKILTKDIFRGGSRAAATSKVERFLVVVKAFQPLTITTERSILDVAAALDPPLIFHWLELITGILSFLKMFTVRKTTTYYHLTFQKLPEYQEKNYISGIFWAFKSKLLIIYVATYITLFLPDSNNYLLYV